jgi:hypothetical protein
MIKPVMTMADAVRIARSQAAKETGDIRAAITMLCDLVQYHHDKRTRKRNARRRKAE